MTRTATCMACVLGGYILRLPIQLVIVSILTSGITWRQYALWSPIVHSPLPLKLLFVRQTYILLMQYLTLLERCLINWLTDLESRVFEATALTESSESGYVEPQPNDQ